MNSRILALLLGGTILLPVGASANATFSHALDFSFASQTRVARDNDVWSVGWNSLFSYDIPGPQLQIGGTYDHFNSTKGSFDLWSAGGDAFWRDRKGTIGISAGYGSIGSGVKNQHVASYGAFGEWYATKDFTFRMKGGAFDGGIEGWYAGSNFEAYLMPDLAASVTYNYTRGGGNRAHDVDLDLEYLLSYEFPLSVVVGYERASTRKLNTNAYVIRLRYRLGVDGSLIEMDRTGPTSWDGLVTL